MLVALVTVGSVNVLGGALVAALSDHWPQRQVVVQECGGGLFLLGITLIACCFPQI
ncbi:MAG TPA: hypothetical protein VG328_18445 [Stellaceae bacterium]|jgi:hypothetical protein|nr:hypothetical protein [Stellaceae bacterium]